MYRRLTYIENRYVLSDSGEHVTNINVRDPVTCIWVELRATNGATRNLNSPLAACVESIELVDGSNVLWSVNGYEALGITYYNLGYDTYQVYSEAASATQVFSFPILFGRYLGDTYYAFDPNRFANPQLRISWDLEAVNSVGATGFVSGSCRLSVIADVMDGAPSPVGLLSAKEIYSFTTESSGTEYIDLPTDATIRGLYVRCHEDGVGAFGNIDNVKLTCDNDKFVIVDMRREDALRSFALSNKAITYKHDLVAANGSTVYFVTKLNESVSYVADTADTVVTSSNAGIGQQTLGVYTAGVGSTDYVDISAMVTGWLPFGLLRIPFGIQEVETTWFDPSTFRSVRLELEQSNAGGDASVVVESLRTY